MDEKIKVIQAYQTCFSTDAGKSVLEHLKWLVHYNRCHITTDGPIDPNRLIADEARRGLVLGIITKVEANPDESKPEFAITEDMNNG
jgi:hypothetical protein